jgi:transcriptional regulator with XRE-family HTH domain
MPELSAAVKIRRGDMGLTQSRLAALSGLSRATVNQVETGAIKDLSLSRAARLLRALGLAVTVTAPRTQARGPALARDSALVLAARTAGVSYRGSMSAGALEEVLRTGLVPHDILPHVRALLDEASPALLAAVVEQLHLEDGVERAQVWRTMRTLAHQLKCSSVW